jgi:hypothetical protein
MPPITNSLSLHVFEFVRKYGHEVKNEIGIERNDHILNFSSFKEKFNRDPDGNEIEILSSILLIELKEEHILLLVYEKEIHDSFQCFIQITGNEI